MNIKEYIISEYEKKLEEKYLTFKKNMECENFIPGPEEVWKMYSVLFNENKGAYEFAAHLLDLDQCDENGRLNDLWIYLDKMNKNISDYCTAYVTGLNKGK